MHRIAIVGPPGSGSSALARRVGDRLEVAHVDLDSLRPASEPTSTADFRDGVARALAAAERDHGGWVVAGNHLVVADLTHGRADTIIWLDLPRRRTVGNVLRRSLRRPFIRGQRWNDRLAALRALVDPRRSAVVEAWRAHPVLRRKYETLASTPLWASASVRRVHRSGDADELLDDLSG